MTIQKMQMNDCFSPWTRFFLAGPTGSGKTTVAGTFPNPLFIVPKNENSHTTLRENGVQAEVWTVESKLDMETVINELRVMYSQNPSGFYETVVIESLTHYGDLVVNSLTNDSQIDMNQQKWGQFSNHLSWIHTSLSCLDAHLVFTAQAVRNDKTNDMEAMVQGRAKLCIPSACDAIGYCDNRMTKDGPMYTTYFQKYKGFPARSRYKWLPSSVDNFNFGAYYNAAFNNQ